MRDALMAQLTVRLFGYPTITLDQNTVSVDERKALGLLAYLAVSGERHSREELSTLLWPDHSQAQAYANLRHALWSLRQVGLGDWLVADRETIALRAGYWADVSAFAQALRQGAAATAIELYRAEFLAGFSLRDALGFDDWQVGKAERLRHALISGLQQLIADHTARGEYQQGLTYTRRWLQLDPLHEAAQRQLMQLYVCLGQRGAALQQYQEYARLLRAELDVTPDPATAALYSEIQASQSNQVGQERSAADGQLPAETAVRAACALPAPQLPAAPTRLIGRSRELRELHNLLAAGQCRLLTLTGPGGIGKTRLAVEIARQQQRFADGVVFVALEHLEDAAQLPATLLSALGLSQRQAESRQQLLSALRDRQLLLLLDNFEQLLDGVELLSAILEAAPQVTLLLTSRAVLSIQEEWVYPLSGLELPQTGTDAADQMSAVQLFAEHARRIQPHFSLPAERAAVIQICRLVEGVPLAIELAAAWTRNLPCAMIAAEIERDQAFLETNLRNRPPRHRSMRSACDSSWRLLDDRQRAVFARLSVFHGSFDRPAAEKIAGATLRLLVALVDMSLLRRTADGRYQVPELLRQYGAWRLQQSPAEATRVAQLHSGYYLRFVALLAAEITGGKQRASLDALEAEIGNIETAWRSAVARDDSPLLRPAMHPLSLFWIARGRYADGIALLELARPCFEQGVTAGDAQALAGLLVDLGWLHLLGGRMGEASATLECSAALCHQRDLTPPPGLATDPLIGLAVLALYHGDYVEGARLGLLAWRRAEEQQHHSNMAFASRVLTRLALAQGHSAAAECYARQAYAAFMAGRDRYFAAVCITDLGDVVAALGQYDEARHYYQASYTLYNEFGDLSGMADALGLLGRVAWLQSEPAAAHQLYQRSLALHEQIDQPQGMARALNGIGLTAARLGHVEEARQACGRAIKLVAEAGLTPLLLTLLTTSGEVLAEGGRAEWGPELLVFVLRHPASDREANQRAQELLPAYETQLAPEIFGAALRRGRTGDLPTLLTRLQAELATPLSGSLAAQRGAVLRQPGNSVVARA